MFSSGWYNFWQAMLYYMFENQMSFMRRQEVLWKQFLAKDSLLIWDGYEEGDHILWFTVEFIGMILPSTIWIYTCLNIVRITLVDTDMNLIYTSSNSIIRQIIACKNIILEFWDLLLWNVSQRKKKINDVFLFDETFSKERRKQWDPLNNGYNFDVKNEKR